MGHYQFFKSFLNLNVTNRRTDRQTDRRLTVASPRYASLREK